MSEELKAQIEELKSINKELQDKLKVALDAVEVYTTAEVDELIASITEKSEVAEEDLREKSLDELKAIDAILSKVKIDYKGVRAGSGADAKPSNITVGDLYMKTDAEVRAME